MANPRKRLGVGSPIIHEYPIADAQNIQQDGQNVTICKYLKPKNTGLKDENGRTIWEDIVMKEWVANPDNFNLKGLKIRVETSIVE